MPYREPSLPLVRDQDAGGWKMVQNSAFAAELEQRLQALGAPDGGIVILLCRSGEESARASEELALRSYPNVFSVIDGFEGDVAADGRRSLNGWKNAGLPWTARVDASLVYGASN
jgi:rhodanese-related sulfurtransferase